MTLAAAEALVRATRPAALAAHQALDRARPHPSERNCRIEASPEIRAHREAVDAAERCWKVERE